MPIDFAVNAPAPLPESSRSGAGGVDREQVAAVVAVEVLGEGRPPTMAGAEVTVHHVLRRPIAVRNESPVTVMEPDEPMTVTWRCARPRR